MRTEGSEKRKTREKKKEQTKEKRKDEEKEETKKKRKKEKYRGRSWEKAWEICFMYRAALQITGLMVLVASLKPCRSTRLSPWTPNKCFLDAFLPP